MSKGKTAAQAAHASVTAYIDGKILHPRTTNIWVDQGMKKIILKAPEKVLLELYQIVNERYLNGALIKDAGKTELKPGTITAVAIGPGIDSAIDMITKGLKLL